MPGDLGVGGEGGAEGHVGFCDAGEAPDGGTGKPLTIGQAVAKLLSGNGDTLGHAYHVGELEIDKPDAARKSSLDKVGGLFGAASAGGAGRAHEDSSGETRSTGAQGEWAVTSCRAEGRYDPPSQDTRSYPV